MRAWMIKANCQRVARERLLGQVIEAERATAEVENVIRGDTGLEISRNCVEALLTLFARFQQAGLLHNSKMLGNVVLRSAESIRDLVDAHGLLE